MKFNNIISMKSYIFHLQSVETPKSSVVRSRLQANRKRQHQSAVSRYERVHTEKISDGEETEQGQNNIMVYNVTVTVKFLIALLLLQQH